MCVCVSWLFDLNFLKIWLICFRLQIPAMPIVVLHIYIFTQHIEEKEDKEGSREWFDEKGDFQLWWRLLTVPSCTLDVVVVDGWMGLGWMPFFFIYIVVCAGLLLPVFLCVPSPSLLYKFILFISNKRQWKGAAAAPSFASSFSPLHPDKSAFHLFFSSSFFSFFLEISSQQDRFSLSSSLYTRVEFRHTAAAAATANWGGKSFYALLYAQ